MSRHTAAAAPVVSLRARYRRGIRPARILPVAALVAVSAGVATTLSAGAPSTRPGRHVAPARQSAGGRATGSGQHARAQPKLPPSAIRVTISGRPDSRPIPPGFVGLSIEYHSAPAYFGAPEHPDTVLLALVRKLAPRQSPVIRFGGDTTDWTWAPTPGVARPGGIRYTLDPSWTASV